MADPPWRQALERHAEAEQTARHDLADRVTVAIAGHVDARDRLLLRLDERVRDLEDWQSQQRGARAVLTIVAVLAGVVSALLVIWDRLSPG